MITTLTYIATIMALIGISIGVFVMIIMIISWLAEERRWKREHSEK